MTSRLPAKKARVKSIGARALRLQAGGTLIPGKHLYITREADARLYDLLTSGEYCNILTSRQMGKSSLMASTARRLSDEGYHVVIADMGLLVSYQITADQWYRALLKETVRELKLPIAVDEWWQATREATPELRLLRFFSEEIVAKLPGDKPIILFVDEIDGTLDLPFSDDFFIAMRAMYNQRAFTPAYRRIVFCPVGVASPNELIKDKKKTPYNIGKTIELRDFDAGRDDLSTLAELVGGEAALTEILRFTSGQPYLTVKAAERFVQEGWTPSADADEFIDLVFGSHNEALSDPHFTYIQSFIAKRAEDPLVALKLYRQILSGAEDSDQITPAHIALKLAGIIKRGPKGTLVVRNEIYRRLFTEEWAAKTAEEGARQCEEAAGLRAFAEVSEKTLREALDNYRLAFGAWKSLKNNPAYAGDADELWAQLFECRALRAEQGEQRYAALPEQGEQYLVPLQQRDEVLLWWLRALKERPSFARTQAVRALIGADYERLLITLHHDDKIHVVAFSLDGSTFATGSADGTVRLWNTVTGQLLARPLCHEESVWTLAFSPDGRSLATGSDDGTARLWDTATGQLFAPLLRQEGSVSTLAFSPDGRSLATGSDDGTARLWDTATGQLLAPLLRQEGSVWTLAFSPDGRSLATGSDDGTTRLWDTATGQLLAPLLRQEGSVWTLAFSPDGRLLATGSRDGTAHLWYAATGQLLAQPLHHEVGVLTLAFSPDGRLLATGSRDGTARFWDAATGQLLAQPLSHEAGVLTLAFSPDGRLLATGSDDGTARLWDVQMEQSHTPPLLQGDPVELLREWERRLGLKINDAGEIVLLY